MARERTDDWMQMAKDLARAERELQIEHWVYSKYPLIPTLWMIFEDSTFAFRSGDKHRSRRIYGK